MLLVSGIGFFKVNIAVFASFILEGDGGIPW